MSYKFVLRSFFNLDSDTELTKWLFRGLFNPSVKIFPISFLLDRTRQFGLLLQLLDGSSQQNLGLSLSKWVEFLRRNVVHTDHLGRRRDNDVFSRRFCRRRRRCRHRWLLRLLGVLCQPTFDCSRRHLRIRKISWKSKMRNFSKRRIIVSSMYKWRHAFWKRESKIL